MNNEQSNIYEIFKDGLGMDRPQKDEPWTDKGVY